MDHCDSEIQSGKNGLDFLRLVLENYHLDSLCKALGRGSFTPPHNNCGDVSKRVRAFWDIPFM